MTPNRPMDFIRDFLNYVNKEGIYDKFDKDTQQMVTSPGVEALIKEAQSYLPKKLGKGEAAKLMRNLSDEEREKLIAAAEDDRVIDLRKTFQRKMSENGGAQGIVTQLVEALESGDNSLVGEAIENAQNLVKGLKNPEEFMKNDN